MIMNQDNVTPDMRLARAALMMLQNAPTTVGQTAENMEVLVWLSKQAQGMPKQAQGDPALVPLKPVPVQGVDVATAHAARPKLVINPAPDAEPPKRA